MISMAMLIRWRTTVGDEMAVGHVSLPIQDAVGCFCICVPNNLMQLEGKYLLLTLSLAPL